MLASAQAETLAGMLTSGVAGESMVHDVGWTMMDIGKRIERGLWLAALLQALSTTAPPPSKPSSRQPWWRVNRRLSIGAAP